MPTPHIINDCFVHRSIKSLFIKSPFAFSKIPLHSSRLRRWHRLAFHFISSRSEMKREVKEEEAWGMWGKPLKDREGTCGNLLGWMYEPRKHRRRGCLSFKSTQLKCNNGEETTCTVKKKKKKVLEEKLLGFNYHSLKNKKREYLSNLMLEGEMWHECTTFDEQLLRIHMH